jgi:folate-dependent tRNA-U54 methylase TrmFO/GidA
VVAHLQNAASPDFQPANVTWTWFSPLPGKPIREKRLRRAALAARALERIDAFAKAVAVTAGRESALATAGAPAE